MFCALHCCFIHSCHIIMNILYFCSEYLRRSTFIYIFISICMSLTFSLSSYIYIYIYAGLLLLYDIYFLNRVL